MTRSLHLCWFDRRFASAVGAHVRALDHARRCETATARWPAPAAPPA